MKRSPRNISALIEIKENEALKNSFPFCYCMPENGKPKNMVIVGALDNLSDNSIKRLETSCWHPEYVDLFAPGGMIYTTRLKKTGTYKSTKGENTGNMFEKQSGTSVAAPFVTGAVGLLAAKNPDLKASDYVNALCKGAFMPNIDDKGYNLYEEIGNEDIKKKELISRCGILNIPGALEEIKNQKDKIILEIRH